MFTSGRVVVLPRSSFFLYLFFYPAHSPSRLWSDLLPLSFLSSLSLSFPLLIRPHHHLFASSHFLSCLWSNLLPLLPRFFPAHFLCTDSFVIKSPLSAFLSPSFIFISILTSSLIPLSSPSFLSLFHTFFVIHFLCLPSLHSFILSDLLAAYFLSSYTHTHTGAFRILYHL